MSVTGLQGMLDLSFAWICGLGGMSYLGISSSYWHGSHLHWDVRGEFDPHTRTCRVSRSCPRAIWGSSVWHWTTFTEAEATGEVGLTIV